MAGKNTKVISPDDSEIYPGASSQKEFESEIQSLRDQLFQSVSNQTVLETQAQVLRRNLEKRTSEIVELEVTISLLQQQIEIMKQSQGQQAHLTTQ